MKISVVIPIYNGEKFIENTVNSILSQPYNSFEVLCIDDGSTDDSANIVKSIAKQDPRVRYIQKPNGGVHSARNMGIELSTGDYVTFLDQDDLWLKNSITDELIDRICKDNCDFYKCSYYDVNYNITRGVKHEVIDGAIINRENDKMQHHSSYIYKTEFLQDNEIFTDEFRCEDWRFLIRCYAFAKKAECIDHSFFMYRNNFESVSHSGKAAKSIESSLNGFVKYEKESNNEFIKKSCGIWATGKIFDLIDEMIFEKDVIDKIREIVDKYQLEYLIQNYWSFDLDKMKFGLINNDIKTFIKKQKKKILLQKFIYNVSHKKLFIKFIEKKKYPIEVRTLV